MPQPKSSLPTQITYVTVGLAITITFIYSFILLGYSLMVEDNIFNRLVTSEAEYIQQKYSESGQVTQPRARFISLHENWQDVPSLVVDQYQAKPSQIEFTLTDGKTIHIKVFKLDKTEFVLLADVAGFEVSREYLPRMIKWLIGLALLLSTIVFVVGYYMVRRLTKPIKTLADQVSSWSVSATLSTFSDQYPNNELRTLASKIEYSYSQLQQALTREVNFTRDVSHEIRTPISVIKNVISNNQETQSISAEEFEQVSRANFELEKITNTLLALARNESSQVMQVNLTELVENTLLQHFELNHSNKGQSLEINLNLEENVYQLVNQNLAQILLNNVLSNIVQYAAEPQIRITLTQYNMSFKNNTAELVPNNPQRQGVKGLSSSGIGQGLNLIERICELNHWTLNAHYKSGTFMLEVIF